MAIIMDGKAVAKNIRVQVAAQVAKLPTPPGLAVIIVGENPASRVYVDNKKKDCKACGIQSHEFALPEDVGEDKLLDIINNLNRDPDISGILVQLPLPPHYNVRNITQAISPAKDVDAFHMINVGGVMSGDYGLLPCTPAGVMALLDAYGIEPKGKHCVVVGRSNLVGKPMGMMLLNRDATVTICHVHTADLGSHTRQADILVVAVGKPGLITADMVKPGAVVVDIGITRTDEGLLGDVDYEPVKEIASCITPVPGGVGPMTRAMLMQNTLLAASR